MRVINRIALGLGAAAIATAALAASHSGTPPAVKARQAHMQLQTFNLGQLGAMAKGEMPYDSEVAGKLAEDMVALSGMLSGPALSLYFPAGTAAGEIDGTRSLPAIWENLADVQAMADALTKASVALAAAATTDLDALKAAMGPVGQACSECHKAYRAPAN